jgi:hypothetical protein
MTVLQTLEQANKDAGIKKMIFADIREFNSFVDSFNFIEFPMNVIVPFTDNGTWNNGFRSGILALQGWVLTRVPEDTNDYRSLEMEERYLADMRLLAKKFIGSLIESDLRNIEVQAISDSVKPEYAFLNMHTFGVSYTLNLPIKERIC